VAFLLGAMEKWNVHPVATLVWVNGAPGLRIEVDGQLAAAMSVTVDEGRITRIYSVANPDKLARFDAEAALTR
jgi:hypothetical protein